MGLAFAKSHTITREGRQEVIHQMAGHALSEHISPLMTAPAVRLELTNIRLIICD